MSNQAAANTLGVAVLDGNERLTLQQAAFFALLKIGLNQRDAYRFVRPDVTKLTAAKLSSQLAGRFRNAFKPTMSQAVSLLTDWVAVSIAMDASDPQRVAALKELNRVLGRYETAVSVSDLSALLGGLAPAPRQDADGLEELAEVVDLTRPPLEEK